MDFAVVRLSNLVLLLSILVPGSHSDNFTFFANETSLQCGNTICRHDLDEICYQALSVCECPEKKDRRNESEKCTDYKQMTFPLILARQQATGQLLYNYSYSDKSSQIYSSFVDLFHTGMTNVLQQSAFYPNFIRLSIDRIIRPTDVNRSLTEGGLWVEFTLRIASEANSDETEIYAELMRVISTKSDYSVGGVPLKVNRYQPPIQCFNNNCPHDGLCIPTGDRFACQCQVGCRDLDPAKAGRVCSCPCNSPDTHSCGDFASCIPFDNSDGYVCKCKTGFVDFSALSPSQDQRNLSFSTRSGSRCVIDHCLQRRAECGRMNATCVVSEFGSDCRCLDGYVDVRKSPAKVDAICLKPKDVDECLLRLHECFPPSTCAKSGQSGYRCLCPDGSDIQPDSLCPLSTRLACDHCNHHGTCLPSSDNLTTICECDDGFSGYDCSVKVRNARLAQVWKIGEMEIEWSWIAFGVGAGIGIFICILIFAIIKITQRLCRKKPTVRPSSVDDEIFNFREVARNVYGTGAMGEAKRTGTLRVVEESPPPQYMPIEGPYAVSEVSVSTFKRNGTHT